MPLSSCTLRKKIANYNPDFTSCFTACMTGSCSLKIATVNKSYIMIDSSDSPLFTEKSHRKLLLQVEEAVETLLNDAQRRITATQEASFFTYINVEGVKSMFTMC